MGLSLLLDGVLDTCDEEGRRNPENHQTVGGLQWRNQPQAAMQCDVAITERMLKYNVVAKFSNAPSAA